MAGLLTPAFYQMKDFVPEIDRAVAKRLDSNYLHFSETSHKQLSMVLQYFDEMSYERVGVLPGEYLLYGGTILIKRDGTCIKANMALEQKYASIKADDFIATIEFAELKAEVMSKWDQFPAVENPILISHPYSGNYFHYTFDIVTKNRFFGAYRKSPLWVQERDLARPFQKDLFYRTAGQRSVHIHKPYFCRVRDPLLSHEILSEEAVAWVRKKIMIPVHSDKRNIYLRRTPEGKLESRGGGIWESPKFEAFLKEYAFETVDLGYNLNIEDQVKQLDGAAVILAPHGAALTNLVYLKPPLTVIEIIGSKMVGAFYMHLCSMLNMHYHGLFSSIYDANQNFYVNIDELHDIMKKL